MKTLLVLLWVAGLASGAEAACRRAGVEWIVGGPAPVDCDAPSRATAPADARPKISPASQRQRDEERLSILAQELAQEERLLARPADAATALRTRDNIAALKREIARMNAAAR